MDAGHIRTAAAAGMLAVAACVARGAERSFAPAADNTLFSETTFGDRSNALGPHLFAGSNRLAERRRGLIRFDFRPADPLSPWIPNASIVESARFQIYLSQAAAFAAGQIGMHRVSAGWGNGTSNAPAPGGQGAPATPDDPTWRHRFFDKTLWTTPGGDFVPATSGLFPADNVGLQTVDASGVAADVQAWVDGLENNGWLLKAVDESAPQSAVRLDSVENDIVDNRPRLTVRFRVGGDANSDDKVDIGDFAVVAANFNLPLSGPDNGDFNRDDLVDIGDFAIVAGNFNLDFSTSGRGAVPEPSLGVVLVGGAYAAARRRHLSRRTI